MGGALQEQGLTEHDMPALFRMADATALGGQRRYYRQVLIQLAMLLLGTVAGLAVQIFDVPEIAYVGVAAYIVLVVIRVTLKVGVADRIWYENRLIAESVKSLAWRYAVGGAPFGMGQAQSEEEKDLGPDALLGQRIAGLLSDVSNVPLPDPSQGVEQITPAMRQLRESPLEERVAVYEEHRVLTQLRWYADKAKVQSRRASRLDVTMVVASGVAVFFGFAQALRIVDANLLSLAGIVAAIVATWSATTHYSKQAPTTRWPPISSRWYRPSSASRTPTRSGLRSSTTPRTRFLANTRAGG